MGALDTGVSGLRAHQNQLDVVANNLANMNTIGFKSQATTFRDLTYETIRAGSGAGEGAGSVNPQQIGSGVAIGQISRNFSQGSLEATGELLDFAIQGEGFFVVDGTNGRDLFTRAGSFTLDERGDLVDPGTGYRVQRSGTAGEASEGKFGFQTSGDSRINIPLGAAIPGTQTRNVDFFGSLPTSGKPPTFEALTSSQPYETSGGPAVPTTLLNDLTINTVDYTAGDTIEFSGTNPDGTPFSTSLAADTATMQDVVDQINSVIEGAVASLLPDGSLTVTADETGDAFSSLTIENAAGNVGSTDFIQTSMIVSTEGSEGDKFDVSLDIYDKRGNANRVNFQFTKFSDNGWNLAATLDSGEGVFLDAQVNNIFFNEDGTYSIAGEEGDGDRNIELKFDSIAEQQVIDLSFDNMNHIATEYSASLVQNGTPTGNLVSVAVGGDGLLSGLSSNGEVLQLAQLSIARFANVEGLDGLGSNFFGASVNSGVASIGTGLTAGRGSVVGNQLEGSNVDLAQEFTRLIVAQRGFSANARTITVADEVLEELTNIIR